MFLFYYSPTKGNTTKFYRKNLFLLRWDLKIINKKWSIVKSWSYPFRVNFGSKKNYITYDTLCCQRFIIFWIFKAGIFSCKKKTKNQSIGQPINRCRIQDEFIVSNGHVTIYSNIFYYFYVCVRITMLFNVIIYFMLCF